MRLQGKVAIITGGGQGIGEGIACKFASEGAAVAIAARTVERLEDVAARIGAQGGRVLPVPTDMRNEADIANLVERTVAEFGRIDILVNNAGISWFGYNMTDDIKSSLARYDDVLSTNLRGPWITIHHCVPHMQVVGAGSIINIGSVHGKLGAAQGSAYSASKGALDAMTRAIAIELAPYHIRVNNVAPGAIEVRRPSLIEALREAGDNATSAELERLFVAVRKGIQPLPVVGEPEDIAFACVYLASDEARFVTGATLMVDGGSTAMLAEPGRISTETIATMHRYRQFSAEARKRLSERS